MRIPKAGERWKRRDGSPGDITVQRTSPAEMGFIILAARGATVSVTFRYQDGVESSKTLPGFLDAFRPPSPCPSVSTTGFNCEMPFGHDGSHGSGAKNNGNDYELWTFGARLDAQVFMGWSERPQMTKAEINEYCGFDPEHSDEPREPADWTNPAVRARYMGILK